MKKPVLIVVVVVFATVLLIGCSSIVRTPNTDLSALQEQLQGISDDISSLKSDVEKLKSADTQPTHIQENDADSAPAAVSPSAVPQTEATPASQVDATALKTTSDYDIAGLTERVTAMISKMDTATAQTMFDVKSAAKTLEREIEMQEDTAEYDFRQGNLSRADYGAVDTELERLEEMLDNAEDAMEFRLGYDD